MVIYVDVIFIENFIINTFLLKLALDLMHSNNKKIWIYEAGLLGAIYTLVMLFPSMKMLTYLPFKLLIALLMVFISTREKNIVALIKILLTFILLSLGLGGICFFLSLSQNDYSFQGGLVLKDYYLKYLILGIMIFYIFYNRVFKFIKDKFVVKSLCYDVFIEINKKSYIVKGFLDTGNELKEPVTNLPVIIVDQSVISKDVLKECSSCYSINYKTVNGHFGSMKGFKPDKLVLYTEKFKKEREAIICLSEENLSIENEYRALLSRGII